MPIWFILLPHWLGISIYEFSSWARASIVPLLVVLNKKPMVSVPFNLEELKSENPPLPPFDPSTVLRAGKGGWGGFFLLLDRIFKTVDRLPWHPGKKRALAACERWIREHIARTEDIYPAMAYAAMAMKALEYPNSDPTIQKAFHGLKKFQQRYLGLLPPLPGEAGPMLGSQTANSASPTAGRRKGAPTPSELIHQQCCISPLWDTPWAGIALLESGLPTDDPSLIAAARYLIERQITDFKGDWRFKNPEAESGGWAFEFQNDFFPDVDDTIEILLFLNEVSLPDEVKRPAVSRALQWLLSMQSSNGGWAAFDKDNTSAWVNKIPFSDHGACLDPPTPDITGRALELLARLGFQPPDRRIQRGLEFLRRSQEPCGAWRGRWGVNFIYGTWAVLQGLGPFRNQESLTMMAKGAGWLKSIQNRDGGWGESCLSDRENRYVPLGLSLPSQTAWGVMALIAAGERDSREVQRGIEFLLEAQTPEGRWEERHFTGTGFPGHFYIRYHGYRQYFPLLALARHSKEGVPPAPKSP